MLTQNQIIKLYQIGIELKFKRKQDINHHKGEYEPDTLEILIYNTELASTYDRDITILHEFIHARDDHLRPNIIYDKRPEEEVEEEASKTYDKKPEVLKFLKLIYAF